MSAPVRAAARTYYPHVEGLRGVAALYVFLFHIWQIAVQHATTGTLLAWLAFTPFMQYGHFAVTAFIVISGYCLGLPVALRDDLAFSPRRFFQRRARRLMPAYVPVVLLSAIPFAAVALVDGRHVNLPHIALAIVLHLGLVHNLSFATTEYLNGPLWSIALEAQIYVVFALLLVPVWRRFGLAAQFALALVLGLLPHFVLHSFDWTCPWLVALFSMGVIAARFTARASSMPKLPWGLLSIAAAAVAVVLISSFKDGVSPDAVLWPMDLALGAAVALFFVASVHDERIPLTRFLSSRPVLFLGTFSYSLYLIHAPLVDLTGTVLHRVHAGTLLSIAVWSALIVVVLVLAYAFYRVFERPFLSGAMRAARDVEVAEAIPAIVHDGPELASRPAV
jgi:peptidoglycan/LPS O-acetylase OafA/YrhL